MPAPGDQSGPLTQAQLQAIWEGTTDTGYVQPLEAAGEGQGFEAYTQMFAQFARVSKAVDVTTQAMYILPSSAQTNPSAGGGQPATVTLTFSRATSNAFIKWALTFEAGQIVVLEQTTDWGTPTGVEVQTGRQYVLTETLVLPAGDPGPWTVQAQSVTNGYGYNNPLIGTLQVINQPGTGYYHDRASVSVTPFSPTPAVGIVAGVTLTTVNEPDMFQPFQLGQYVLMTAGANQGNLGRITGFIAPNAAANVGSAVLIAYEQSAQVTTSGGIAFQAGEILTFLAGATPVGEGQLIGFEQSPTFASTGTQNLVYVLRRGAVASGNHVIGQTSGGNETVNVVQQNDVWTSEAPPIPAIAGSGANWKVLDWVNDLGVSVTNAAQPTNGRSAMLDELGYERNIPRGAGQVDSVYAPRVAAVVDTVSPNAIKRALTRTLGIYGWCFREVGNPIYLPGLYFDRTDDPKGDFYDTNCLLFTTSTFIGMLADEVVVWNDVNGLLVGTGYFGGYVGGISTTLIFVLKGSRQPLRVTWAAGDTLTGQTSGVVITPTGLTVPTCKNGMRESVWLDYTDMRAYFQVGVPLLEIGEFGFNYDGKPLQHIGGFYDQRLLVNFYDGYAAGARALYRSVWQEVERVRAGGTTWDLYPELVGCP